MKSSSILLLLLLVFAEVSANEAFTPASTAPSSYTATPRSLWRQIRTNRNGARVPRTIPDAAHHRLGAGRDSAVANDASKVSCAQQPKCGTGPRFLTLRGGAFVAGQEMLTFGQNLAGSVFSTFAVMYGLACSLAPKRTARLFYGYDEKDKGNNVRVGKFLMRLMGAITCGLGLTAAFAIGSELEQLGHMPSLPALEHAIGIGLIPRLLFVMHSLFAGIPSSLRINKIDAWVSLVETSLFLFTVFSGKLVPEFAVNFEVAFCLLLGPLFFFKPSILFKEETPPSRHEKFMTRLAASYTIMSAVLLAALMHPAINALPSVGLTALTWVATLIHLTFVRKDVKECGSSVLAHIAMMASGLAVAAGGLRHYLVM